MPDPRPLRIYTDGACSGNPGPGGWAWASSRDHSASGGDPATTNNKMELLAVLRAIEDNPSGPLTIVMDSTYVKDGLEKWSRNWIRNGWMTKDRKPVKNRELWEPLVAARDRRASELTFEWVKGHSGDPMNDLVDELAVVERDRFRSQVGPTPGAPGGGGRIDDLPEDERRAERRRRDGRIPAGHLLVVVGHGPDELGGWDPNPTSDKVRDHLAELFSGYAAMQPELTVVTGARPGAEMLAAEAAIRADVPYVVVLPFSDPDRNLNATSRARFADLVDRATSVVQLEKKSPADKDAFVKAMRRRDVWLANAADQAVLVWDEADNRLDRLFSDLDTKLGSELTVLHP
ncbi:MAG: SLOG family protein [Aquihabitans sp.]